MSKNLRRWLSVAASVLILGLILLHLSRSPEWRAFSFSRLWALVTSASLAPLGAALVATYLSYLIRAVRWKFFLDPIKKASLWVMFAGQILGFSSIYLIGRPGEFVRPAYIARKEKVPITSMVAVWLLERIYDAVALVIVFAVALYWAPLAPPPGEAEAVLTRMHEGGRVLFAMAVAVCAALALFRWRAAEATAFVLRVFDFLPARWRERLAHFLGAFADGLKVIQNWREFLASVISTVVLWVVNISAFWFTFQSLGGELARLPWLVSGLTVFFAVMGMMVQVPGVGGGYQVGIIVALTEIFSVPVEPATGAAILVWILISVPCLLFAAVLLVHEGLSFRKLEAMAEEERARAGN